MKILDRTFGSPAENLACDEALLDLCEKGLEGEILRFWESAERFVVLGYSNKAETEINLEHCRQEKIPVLRRPSGGGTVLQGPGCLNYALILKIDGKYPLKTVTGANRFIMERHREALSKLLGKEITVEGHTDLALGGVKFSGNAQRRKKNALLFHGTFLINFAIDEIKQFLPSPSQEPAYRAGRLHEKFLINLKIPAANVKKAITGIWEASGRLERTPDQEIADLAGRVYKQDDWNFRF